MKSSPATLAVWILLSFYFLYLLFICRNELQKLRSTGRPLNYGIVDIWASILGLTPTLLLVGNLFTERSSGLDAYLFAIFFACAQLVGMFVARVDHVLDTPPGQHGVLASAGYILFGAFLYAIFLMAGFAVAFVLLPASVAYLVCYGYGNVETPRKRKATTFRADAARAVPPVL